MSTYKILGAPSLGTHSLVLGAEVSPRPSDGSERDIFVEEGEAGRGREDVEGSLPRREEGEEEPSCVSGDPSSPGSPPWQRLGPPSNSGDASASNGALGGLAATALEKAGAALTRTCSALASSVDSLHHWLTAEPPTSRYVALIPLLKPRRTRLIVGALMMFALTLAIGVFFIVPRGISADRITIHSDEMSWNKTLRTFQLGLTAEIPIINPNYWKATLHGHLHVMFFDAETGSVEIEPTVVPPRAQPYEINVKIDASNVPSNYTLTIMEHCLGTLEPQTLVFFLKGRLHASYLIQNQDLTEIDTYFMIDCVLISTHSSKEDRAALRQAVEMERRVAPPAFT
eukprot:CAMPEP_0117693092 /NCGR_PEP_ID=MMETSP0804-20121206/26682_1 /TAXON_ID=1074897 /ORGANISM="Tetraselmis astigmatica, Strain CCMP880" /LENGTH=341 /DNA_ID=CAMNT_0005506595 /DNA_START=62 /DNA_END=1087 /DNA_ORIENTATION=-